MKKDTTVEFASAEEKRAVLSDMLDDYLLGQNRLRQRLVHVPVLHLAPGDRARLMARLMREPSHGSIVELTSAMLCSPNPKLADHLTDDECEMLQEAEEGTPPQLTLYFVCFDPPSGDAWAEFYAEYTDYLLHSGNMQLLKQALERQLPLEIAYTLYQDRVIRFIVLQPYPRDQEGARMKKTNK